MTCPICSKDPEPKYRPFCSRRCADLDLGKWLTGAYAVPSDDPEDIEEAHRLSGEAEPPKPH